MNVTQSRTDLLKKWLEGKVAQDAALEPLNGDASFRKYYRIDGMIAVDSPPDTQKNAEFVRCQGYLAAAGVRVPKILASDVQNGFFLQEDLGNEPLISVIHTDKRNLYYGKAVGILDKIWRIEPGHLPLFDAQFILTELNICKEWFIEGALERKLSPKEEHTLTEGFQFLAAMCQKLPQIAMHRDFHSRNLMITDNGQSLAVIDFQDMVKGPLTYDLASLCYDCYVDFDEPFRQAVIQEGYKIYTRAGVKSSFQDFNAFVKLVACQRLIKCLGIFSRLQLRDGKDGYMQYIPGVLQNIMEICGSIKQLHALGALLLSIVSEQDE